MNFFANHEAQQSGETLTTLHQNAWLKIERIASYGQASPDDFWYDQSTDEWVLLVQGQATIAYADGRVIDLAAGDHVFIPRHQRHRVVHTTHDTLWLAVHRLED